MIAHEDEAEDVDLVDLARPRKTVEENRRVAVRLYDLLTCVAPAGHMVVGIRELDAQGTGHEARLRGDGGKVKNKDLTPKLPTPKLPAVVSEKMELQIPVRGAK